MECHTNPLPLCEFETNDKKTLVEFENWITKLGYLHLKSCCTHFQYKIVNDLITPLQDVLQINSFLLQVIEF